MRLLLVLLALLATACSRATEPAATPTPLPVAPTIREGFNGAITVEGHGSGESDEVMPQFGGGGAPIGIDLLVLSHSGTSTFIVNAVQGGQSENVTQAIGAYKGQRPLVVEGPVAFQVTADGDWSISIQRMPTGGQPAFKGTGDAVSAYFMPPAPSAWKISHDGRSGFLVWAHCVSGSTQIEDKTGAVQDVAQIDFGRGPCFWEVQADGNWSLTPST